MQAQEQVIDFDRWMSPEARADRKRKSLKARLLPEDILQFGRGDPLTVEQMRTMLNRRKTGKLDGLINIARCGFDRRFKRVGKNRYRMVE